MSEQKSHYKKVFKSNHLAVADVEDMIEDGHNLILTISHVKQEWNTKVAGKTGNFNIAYFAEKDVKAWVLNSGNSSIVKKFANSGSFVEDWKNIPVQLYIDPTARFGNEITGGVRIRPTQPRIGKVTLTPDNAKLWRGAIEAYKRDGSLAKVLAKMEISVEHQESIIEEGQMELDAVKAKTDG